MITAISSMMMTTVMAVGFLIMGSLVLVSLAVGVAGVLLSTVEIFRDSMLGDWRHKHRFEHSMDHLNDEFTFDEFSIAVKQDKEAS